MQICEPGSITTKRARGLLGNTLSLNLCFGAAMKRIGPAIIALLALACEKVDTGVGPEVPSANFSRFVAMGTSITMGFASDGVYSASQQTSWPNLLAQDIGATFTLPLIDAPGCRPPLAAPLGLLKRIDNTPVLTTSTCAPNSAGVTLPAQNVAIEGATAGDAVSTTYGAGTVGSRVLPAGQTQVSAMSAQNPTFVSVEFGANELLGALSGLVSSSTVVPLSVFQANYSNIITRVKQTGAKAELALVPSDVATFPALRTGPEIAAQRTQFGLLNVSVNTDCSTSTNFVTFRKLLNVLVTAASRLAAGLGPADLSCADIAGTADGILTPGDITALNTLAVQMNTFITAQATANGYATFSLGALYDTAKDGVAFDLATILASPTPFGTKMSLDGIHPSLAGQQILTAAAKAGIIAKYGAITK
jgi:lysophospholipase L1-like esterase